jgi:hypothetical protein
VELAVDLAATYRIVRLIQTDTIFEKQREALIIKYGDRKAAELITCPWCAGIWVGVGVAIARAVAPRIWGIAAAGLASSAGAGVITGLVDRMEHADTRE